MVKKLWQAWDEFWFSDRDLKAIAIFRILLCGTFFFVALGRQFSGLELYSNLGLAPESMALQILPELIRPLWVWNFWPDSWLYGVHTILILSLGLLTLGVGGRGLAFLAWMLQVGLMQRNYALTFGADVIGSIFLLMLAGTQSCEHYSLWKWFRKKASRSCDLFSSVFYRMIQVQLCVIYAYTGFEKLKGMSWWDGTALWSVFANSQMVIFEMGWMRHFPLAIVLMSFLTILFEIYFPVLVFVQRTRLWVLGFGLVFHFGIGILMTLLPFAFVMVSPYILFLSTEERRKLLSHFEKIPFLTSNP